MNGKRFSLLGYAFSFVAFTTAQVLSAGLSHAKVLWDKDEIVVTLANDQACGTNADLEIMAQTALAYENNLKKITAIVSNAMATRSFECSKLATADITGKVRLVVVFRAKATLAKSWVLEVQPSPLEQAATGLVSAVKSVNDLEKIRALETRFSNIPGIENTLAYFLFKNARKKAIASVLNEKSLTTFTTVIEESFKNTGSPNLTKDAVASTIKNVSYFNPALAQRYQDELENRLAKLVKSSWQTFEKKLFEDGDILDGAIRHVNKQAKKLPLPAPELSNFDKRLAAWIGDEIAVYESLLNSGFAIDVAERRKLAASLAAEPIATQFTTTAETIKASITRLRNKADSGSKALVMAAHKLIGATGQSYLDLTDVVKTGLAIASEFEDAGLTSESHDVLKVANRRVGALIKSGLQDLKTKLKSARMTRQRINQYVKQAAILDKLSSDYGGFKAYVIAIEDGIAAGRERACRIQAQAAVEDPANLKNLIVTGNGSLSVADLACHLYRNNHILKEYRPGGLLSFLFPPTLTIDRSGGETEVYQLENSKNTGAWYGKSRVQKKGSIEFDEAAWSKLIDELIIPPPSGKPNARGITECDQLAGDPHDPTAVAKGVQFDKLPPDYDFDRALDACIAAVEYAPSNIRLYYQVARVLGFIGAEKEAAPFLKTAIDNKHTGALYLAAEQSMAKTGEDAFYDAIDYLKLSAAGGYKPARKLLTELVPPGANFYRPLPPPTDTQILAAFDKRRCAPSIFGAQTCVIRTGVHSKNCFQTGAKTFSCELRFTFRCETSGGNQMFSGIVGAICGSNTVSDVVFKDITVN